MMIHASKVACPPSHLAHRLQTAFARKNVSCQGLCWRAGRRTAGVLAMSSASSTVTAPLATPTKVGAMTLDHRVTLAPMTRLRMDPGTEAPKELTALFYEQRASKGGLLVTEAIQINGTARGYVRAPVFETPEQMKGWKLVTDRVHYKGGYIFGQLVHTGRVSHNSLSPSGRIVAPSAVAANGQLYVPGGVKADYSVPHPLEEQEIKQIVKEFARAARDAVNVSGFDGVELHGSNGYLIQQFLAKKTNQRTDQYGGSIANRARFALEVIDACIAEVGAEHVAVKLSPGVTFSDLVEPEEDALETMAYLGPELSKRGLAYVCIGNFNNEPYFRFVGLEKPNVSFDIFRTFRKSYSGVIVANGGLSLEQADEYVKEGTADLAGFGVAFVATPNLPELVLAGKTTADINMSGANPKLWYSLSPDTDAENYTTFPPVPV